MADIENARQLLQEAGLAFPTIPEQLAARLKERGRWLFSTREIDESPYNISHYVNEFIEADVDDYAILSHSGHGANSYALQYYLVRGALGMFLHLEWGGVYMDAQRTTAKIRDCFSLADRIVEAVHTAAKLRHGERVTIVGADFYGSYWLPPGHERQKEGRSRSPAEVLTEVLHWLEN
jgi:hypothetical protein